MLPGRIGHPEIDCKTVRPVSTFLQRSEAVVRACCKAETAQLAEEPRASHRESSARELALNVSRMPVSIRFRINRFQIQRLAVQHAEQNELQFCTVRP